MREPRLKPRVGVVGVTHLGSVICAAWLQLGHEVVAFDGDGEAVSLLRQGEPPISEAGLAEIYALALREGRLAVTVEPAEIARCTVVFIARDTVVDAQDRPDVTRVLADITAVEAHLAPHAILVVSSQVPVGTCRRIGAELSRKGRSVRVAYVPENLRLGRALNDYLEPGRIIVGTSDDPTARDLKELFSPITSALIVMSLESAELAKHATNAFLAVSVTFANQLSDIAAVVGADYRAVRLALRSDPRIGPHAYLEEGIGFSGGTLGRDLQVLDGINHSQLDSQAPLFAQVLNYNAARVEHLVANVLNATARGDRVCILGLTYKPGTSTLRRSAGVLLAEALLRADREVVLHDPCADLRGLAARGARVAADPYTAADGCDIIIVMTEWPAYRQLNLENLAGRTRRRRILDPKRVLIERADELLAAGWEYASSIRMLRPSDLRA